MQSQAALTAVGPRVDESRSKESESCRSRIALNVPPLGGIRVLDVIEMLEVRGVGGRLAIRSAHGCGGGMERGIQP